MIFSRVLLSKKGGIMNISKWIIGTALLLSAPVTYAQANYSCDPCDPCAVSNPCDLCDINFCDMKFDAYVDALYWKVQRSFSHHSDSDYHWGWRLAGIASWKTWDFGLRYTSFTPDDHHHEFDYRVLDVEVGYNCCNLCCGLSLRPFVGGKFAWIEDKHHHHDHEKVDSQGLYIGLGSRWEVCNWCSCDRNIPIALVTRASTGIMDSDFDHEDRRIYQLYNDLYAGLDFTFCDLWCGWDAFFQIGYEVQYWGWNHDDEGHHLGLGGLVLRFGANF